MDLVWLVCLAVSFGTWFASAERHSVFWNSTNPKSDFTWVCRYDSTETVPRAQGTRLLGYRGQITASELWVNFLWDEYTVEVKINDYLDIICPHYTRGELPSQEAERYVLYMVEKEDYEVCKPHSFDQLRWECSRPFAAHAPERFSEKFQRFTPFTLGKEFRQGESYYYISKPLHHHGQECLRLKVDVVGPHGSGKAKADKGKDGAMEKAMDGGKEKMGGGGGGGGGVHNPSNRLPADDPTVLEPKVQKSVGSSGVQLVSLSVFFTLFPVLLFLLLC